MTTFIGMILSFLAGTIFGMYIVVQHAKTRWDK